MKISVLFAVVLLAGACAIQPTPDGPEDPAPAAECGDGVCNGEEDTASCPADCPADSVDETKCGNAVCEDGETVATCALDCAFVVLPPPESHTWVCRGGVDEGGDYFECNSEYLDSAPETVWFVGECPSEGIYGYFAGATAEVAKGDNGWYRLYLTGEADVVCELTYARCDAREDPSCWAQYGLNSATAELAGPYRGCYDSGSCAMFLSRDPGNVPVPEGD